MSWGGTAAKLPNLSALPPPQSARRQRTVLDQLDTVVVVQQQPRRHGRKNKRRDNEHHLERTPHAHMRGPRKRPAAVVVRSPPSPRYAAALGIAQLNVPHTLADGRVGLLGLNAAVQGKKKKGQHMSAGDARVMQGTVSVCFVTPSQVRRGGTVQQRTASRRQCPWRGKRP